MTTHEPDISHLPTQTDVLIVGAGPAGLTLACALAAQGIRYVLIDKADQGGNTSRAAVIHARTLEVLDEIGVTDELCRRGVVVPRFTIRDRDRALLHVPFDGLPTKYPYTLMLPQNITEQILAERLTAGGGTVHWRHQLTGIENSDEGVTATIAGPGNTVHRIRARYVAGCDGMHSAVRELAGIGFTGDRYPESFVLADVRMRWPYPGDEVNLFFSPAAWWWSPRCRSSGTAIVATLDDAPERPDAADVQSLLDARGPSIDTRQGDRRGVEFPLPRASPPRRQLPARVGVPRRRRGTRPQPGRRPGHEHRDPGRRWCWRGSSPTRSRPGPARSIWTPTRRNAAPSPQRSSP